MMVKKFEYQEDVREFTGLVFHCPRCDEVFHLHIATVSIAPSPQVIVAAYNNTKKKKEEKRISVRSGGR